VATLRERMRARREAERRGLRSFTIGVSEDNLRVIAKHGYEGALTTDHEQQAQAVSCERSAKLAPYPVTFSSAEGIGCLDRRAGAIDRPRSHMPR
jgi:hypothetical protein